MIATGTMEQERELTLEQAAVRLGVSVHTVRRRLQAKLIPYRREGQQIRIKERDLEEYIRKTIQQVDE
jgi:excisionase family DNA binding protein